jgi:putative permease
MSGVVKLPAVVVLLSVFFFGAIFGIWGVFFSVPLASFVKSILDNWKYIDS